MCLFSSRKCSEVKLLDHVAVLFLTLWVPSSIIFQFKSVVVKRPIRLQHIGWRTATYLSCTQVPALTKVSSWLQKHKAAAARWQSQYVTDVQRQAPSLSATANVTAICVYSDNPNLLLSRQVFKKLIDIFSLNCIQNVSGNYYSLALAQYFISWKNEPWKHPALALTQHYMWERVKNTTLLLWGSFVRKEYWIPFLPLFFIRWSHFSCLSSPTFSNY